MAKSKLFWHVPSACWYSGNPLALGGIANVGGDIVTSLINTEGGLSDVPVADNFVIERIIGQYMLTGTESVGTRHFAHHRVYVVDSDETGIAIRDIAAADDAETSFLWHQVDYWSQNYDADFAGGWQQGVSTDPIPPTWKGRQGHVDIKVGRRVEQGQSLIWHTQLVFAPAANNTMYMKLWLRMLCREL